MGSRVPAALRQGFLFTVFLLFPLATFAAEFELNSFSELDDIKARVYATHFLMRTTFGPTDAEVAALASRVKQIGRKDAFKEWIENQFSDYRLNSGWETYQEDRGRIWPLAKKMLLDMGYRESDFGEDQGDDRGVYNYNQWKEHAWWHRTLTAKDQLRQRMAWALSQIFVVGEGPGELADRRLDTSANPRWLGLAKYYDDVCITHAFGNYRELIDTVTFSPVMGVYLTSVRNKKADPSKGTFPDENYAREIMQLFSIGLVELETDGELKRGPDGEAIETYDNETIAALARVFTGMVYNNNDRSTSASSGAGVNFHAPMEMHQADHDRDQKVAFNGRLVLPGHVRASKSDALKDISATLDFLAYEHQNTAPFICRQLIQRFVMSNPSRYYVRRVVKVWNENKKNPKQFEEVLKAILLDRIALSALRFKRIRSPQLGVEVVRKNPTEGTRLREPVLRYTALIRAFSPYPDPSFITRGTRPYFTPGGPEGEAGKQYFLIDNNSDNIGESLAQGPFESESVFNFYLPDYQAPGVIANHVPNARVANGKLVSPEFQIISPVTSVRTMNHVRAFAIDSDFDIGQRWQVDRRATNLDVNLDLDRFFEDGEMLGGDREEPTTSQLNDVLEELDMKLCAGTMSSATKKTLLDVCRKELRSSEVDTKREKEDMVQALISVLMVSPDCAVIP